jgi:hypothetical protein
LETCGSSTLRRKRSSMTPSSYSSHRSEPL